MCLRVPVLLRETEVNHVDLVASLADTHEEVVGLDIAVDDARFVGEVERVGDVGHDGGGVLGIEGAVFADDVPQGASADAFHDNVRNRTVSFACLPGVVDGDDGVMVELGGIERFAAESFEERGVAREVGPHHFHGDVASEVAAFLEARLAHAVGAGIPEEHVCLDPGIGFGKTPAHNFELIRRLDVLTALGRPVLVGLSRKSSLGKLFDPDARTGSLAASLGAAVAAFERGASIFRVHDVREHVEALAAAGAVCG